MIAHGVNNAGIISWIPYPPAFAGAWVAITVSRAVPGGNGISNKTTIRGYRPGCFV
jgi:hypothetical protein